MKKTVIEQKRLSRPLGTTYLAIQYQKEPEETKKAKILERIHTNMIDQYVSNGFMLNGRQVPLNQFASFLNLNLGTLIKLMNKSFERVSNLFDDGEGSRISRVGFLRLFSEALELSQSCKSQTLLLKANQGQNYVPFLSAEVNRSLANEISALKPAIDLLKVMMEKTKENPLIPQNNTTNQNIYLTAELASNLISQKGIPSLLTQPEFIDAEIAEEGLLPEVGAKYQDLTKIGIRHNGLQVKDPSNPA